MQNGVIVQWNNHDALVDEDLFFRNFNRLSPYTWEGKSNPNYQHKVTRELILADRDY